MLQALSTLSSLSLAAAPMAHDASARGVAPVGGPAGPLAAGAGVVTHDRLSAATPPRRPPFGQHCLSPRARLYEPNFGVSRHFQQQPQPAYTWVQPIVVQVPVPVLAEEAKRDPVVRDLVKERKRHERRKSTYMVVNPRNGEKVTVKTATPFQWAKSKRLSIINPSTGMEIEESKKETDKELEDAADDDDDDEIRPVTTPRRGSNSSKLRVSFASPRCSMGSELPRTPGGSPDLNSQTGSWSRRNSCAGEALAHNEEWLERYNIGQMTGSMDWPMSREEKKERSSLLQQFDLYSRVEELDRIARAWKSRAEDLEAELAGTKPTGGDCGANLKAPQLMRQVSS